MLLLLLSTRCVRISLSIILRHTPPVSISLLGFAFSLPFSFLSWSFDRGPLLYEVELSIDGLTIPSLVPLDFHDSSSFDSSVLDSRNCESLYLYPEIYLCPYCLLLAPWA